MIQKSLFDVHPPHACDFNRESNKFNNEIEENWDILFNDAKRFIEKKSIKKIIIIMRYIKIE